MKQINVKIIQAFLIMNLFNSVLVATDIYKNAGYAGPQFLLLNYGARPAALAGAFSALADDSNSLVYNPAGLGISKRTEVQLMHVEWLAGIKYEYLSYAQKFSFGSLGLNYATLNSPEMTEIVNEVPGEKFTVKDAFTTLGFGFNFAKWFAMGLNVKTVESKIATKYNVPPVILTDLGIILHTVKNSVAFAMVMQNMGAPMKYFKDPVTIPQTIRASLAFKMNLAEHYSVMNFIVEGIKPVDGDFEYRAGIEHIGGDALALRCGYKYSKYSQELDSLAAWTFGGGLDLGGVFVDYAYAPFAKVGNAHFVSLGYRFKPPVDKKKVEAKLGINFDPNYVSPNGDGVNELTTIRPFVFDITEIKSWTMEIKTSTGGVIKKFSGDTTLPLEIPWSVKDEYNRVLDQGKYAAILTIIDAKKKKAVSPAIDVYIDTTPPQIDIVSSTVAFTPDGDLQNDNLEFKFKSQDDFGISKWVFNITDIKDKVIHTMGATTTITTEKIFIWDGKDADKKYLTNGLYTGSLSVTDLAGNIGIGKIVVKIAVQPLGLEIKLSTPTITPDGDGQDDNVIIELRTANPQRIRDWTLTIVSQLEKPVKIHKSSATLPTIFTWDAKDDFYQKIVPFDRYFVRFVAVDTSGNENTVQEILKVGVKEVPPPKIELKQSNVREEKRGLVVDLSSEIMFGKGAAELHPAAYVALDEVVDLLKKYPNKVSVEGHTDTVGGDAENFKLSSARAWAIYSYLVKRGIDPSRMTVKGWGATKPIASNKTSTGRAKNRRVEIIILKDNEK